MSYRVAIIGTGPNPDDPSREGFGMGYRHARAYRQITDCELVACADIVAKNARRFAAAFDIDQIYEDYKRMLQALEPDIVSVCVPPAVHADIVRGCARSGVVDTIHCEKPMATTWEDCTDMVDAAVDAGVRLTFNHQRRFGVPFRKAKALLDDGAIGELERFEFSDRNLYDMGTHLFDLCNFYTDQTPVEWVIAQVDYRDENVWFGAHNENQALVQWRYDDGVFGLASTGSGAAFVGCYLRIVGSDGTLEIGADGGPPLRVHRRGEWSDIDTAGENVHGVTRQGMARAGLIKLANAIPRVSKERFEKPSLQYRALESVVDTLRDGGESELAASNALDATELIFASWESARQVGRIDLPLVIDDNPLETMVEDGTLLRADSAD